VLKFSTWLLVICLGLFTASPGLASKEHDPYLILISLDGFGWNLQDSHDTPGLDRMAAAGVRAKAMRPVYPSTTFANHYSIATGLYPYQHGLIDNDFPNADRTAWYHLWDRDAVQDGSWYGGEPIWVAAEKSGITSAAFFFVGTEAPIDGISPTYWTPFDASIPGEDRAKQVLDWLSLPDRKRSHMITLYFEHVDTAEHSFGVRSMETDEAIEQVDGYLVTLQDGIQKLDIRNNVSVIVVSDHGQADYQSDSDAFVVSDYVDLKGITVLDHGSYLWLYMQPCNQLRAEHIRDVINKHWAHGHAYLRNESPKRWHVPLDDQRFPDLVLLADPRYRVISNHDRPLRKVGGNHGWDPSFEAMHSIFLARGPRLPAGVKIGEISNLDVYPLMMAILDLPLPDNIDTTSNVLLPLLASPKP